MLKIQNYRFLIPFAIQPCDSSGEKYDGKYNHAALEGLQAKQTIGEKVTHFTCTTTNSTLQTLYFRKH